MFSPEDRIGQVVVLKLDHAIDREHADELEAWAKEKLAAGERFLVWHCGKVLFFDSVGLETLLAITREAASQGARFALCHLTSDCATTLRVTRLERAIEHYLTLEETLKALRGRAA
jgi:anti-anti-sigma factor